MCDMTGIRAAGVLAALLLLAGTGSASAQDSWCRLDDPGMVEAERLRQKLGRGEIGRIPCAQPANAQSLPEELVLPMPCGRNMVFRRVTIPAGHILDHQEVHLGAVVHGGRPEDEARLFAMAGTRVDHIAGAFTRKTAQNHFERSYYIGKYEVTALQYSLLDKGILTPDGKRPGSDEPVCHEVAAAAADRRGTEVQPATGVSWFDAIRFAGAYSEWLIAYDRGRIAAKQAPSLPWEEGATGFLRLPTETEWEFAARGAEAGSATQGVSLYKIRAEGGSVREGELAEIAAVMTEKDSMPDGVQVMPVGRRKPNLLGLYDMIGNADEITFDLFRANRPDQVAGQAGGFVVRGGNAQSPASALGVGARREVPFFTQRGAVRANVTGFRLVVSAPVFMNKRDESFQELSDNPERQKWLLDALNSLRASPDGLGREALRDQIAKLRDANEKDQVDAKQLRMQIELIQAALDRSNTELNERYRRIQRQQFTSILMMVNAIDNLTRRMEVADRSIKAIEDSLRKETDQGKRRQLDGVVRAGRQGYAELERTNTGNFLYYVELVRSMAAVPAGDAERALHDIDEDFAKRRLAWFPRARPIALAHLEEARQSRGGLSEARLAEWRHDIDTKMRNSK